MKVIITVTYGKKSEGWNDLAQKKWSKLDKKKKKEEYFYIYF